MSRHQKIGMAALFTDENDPVIQVLYTLHLQGGPAGRRTATVNPSRRIAGERFTVQADTDVNAGTDESVLVGRYFGCVVNRRRLQALW